MTRPDQLQQLVAGVQHLSEAVERNETAMQEQAAATRKLAGSSRRQRQGLILTCIGLTADLVLSVFIVAGYQRQSCLQDNLRVRAGYADQNFSAEFAKVSGQIKGIDMLARDPRAGVLQFKAASQHYLDVIGAIHTAQAHHPTGQC